MAAGRHLQRGAERVGAMQDKRDRAQALETVLRAFSNLRWMEDHMQLSRWQGPLFDPEHTRVVVADGRVVSVVAMEPRTIRFGPVIVPAMSVGPVGTHDAYRHRGYSAAAMDDAARYMKEHGVLAAYMTGIPNFYNRFGYYPYMAPTVARFRRSNAAAESLPGRLRAMTKADLPAVRRIFDQATAGRICAAARDRRVWDWLTGPGTKTWLFRDPHVIVDARGRVRGLFTAGLRGDAGHREFVVRQDEESCRVALGALVRDARRHEINDIELPMPWDDAMAVFLRQFVQTEFLTRSHPTGGWLLKIVDFPALMNRLEPLFTNRWRAARMALSHALFTLESEIGSVGFSVTSNAVRVETPAGGPRIRVPARWLSGLLTGYYGIREIAPRRGARVPANLAPVMDILFPSGWPYMYRGDNY